MNSDVVVQHVQVWWTKQSRGMPAASLRNGVPAGYLLPDSHGMVHKVAHDEADQFIPHPDLHSLTGQRDRLRYAELALDYEGDQLRVSLQPSPWGMPRRHRRPPAARLADGQWLRWHINYRFVRISGGEWHYRLDTFNIAFRAFSPNLFLGEPTRTIDERAVLR